MIIIPARIASSRFPRKVLAPINQLPMVIATAKNVSHIDEVCIATDSTEVVEVAQSYGFYSLLTDPSHQSGTDRVFEAASKLKLSPNEPIINVQADEPFLESHIVTSLLQATKRSVGCDNIIMCSCYHLIPKEKANDPNIVKTITDKNGFALYFSRATIPFVRDENTIQYKAHLGVYGYTLESLQTFCSLPPSYLENTEKLEQLRALENGYRIAMQEVQSASFGIDTPDDLQKALQMRHSPQKRTTKP